jgi:S-adenosylmethionine hydrolase
MGRSLFTLFLLLFPLFQYAQEEPATIKVVKQSNLAKAAYDNVEYKIAAIDKYGNVVDHAIKSFEIHYLEKKNKVKIFKSSSESLTPEMLEDFKKLKEAKKIFFTQIIAEDEYGNIVRLPDVIEVQFPICKLAKEHK